MFNQPYEDYFARAARAQEIDLRVRDLEKRYALMNALNRAETTADPLAGVKKATRRLAGLFSALFLG